MEYKLDIKEILKKKANEIEKLKNFILTQNEINFINLDIESYNSLLINFLLPSINFSYMSKEKFIKQSCDISENLLTKTQRAMYKSLFNFSNELNELNNFKLTNKTLTISDQKQLIFDNYIIPTNIKNKINELFIPSNKKLIITKRKNKNFTYPFFNGECYLSCTNNNDIFGFVNLCHEIGHFYEHYNSDNRLNKIIFSDEDNIYNYKEVNSIFFELLSIKILVDNNIINQDEFINLLKKTKYDNFYDPTLFLIFDEVNKTKKVSTKDMIKILKDYKQLYDVTLYGYSYIIAVNLFEQYLLNEKDSFNKLNYLINNITTNDEEKILKNCNITYQDTSLFEKHIKKMK